MRAGRLSTRIFLAFAALALTILVGVAGSLFLVLRGLHADAATSGLAQTLQPLAFQLRGASTAVQLRQAVADFRSQVPDGVQVYLVGPEGRGIDVGEGIAPFALPIDPGAGAGVTSTGAIDGPGGRQRLVYAVTTVRGPNTPGVRAIALVEPDTATGSALRDLGRTMAAVLVILLLVGVPVVWVLSRSVTGPLRRLADATADLPTRASGAGGGPLTPEGPDEVRELTRRFNGMASELGAQRDHETRLLADLRHDLRTPLTVIGGFAEALGDGTAIGADASRAARAIREEATRLERLVAELDTVERLRSGEAGLRTEPVDAAGVVADTVERFAASARLRGVTLVNACASPVGDPALGLAADRVALDRILGNLVDNALAAADLPDRHVWLDARPIAGAPGVGRGIAFSVTDDGRDFPPGEASRAFERFYRGDPSRSGAGSGLGLAIVRELARAHGGDAVAENIAPRGARISVLLPGGTAVADAPPASRPTR